MARLRPSLSRVTHGSRPAHRAPRRSRTRLAAVACAGALLSFLAFLAPAALLAPAAALAQEDEEEEPDFARSGPYVRGSAQLALSTSMDGFLVAPPVDWQPDFGVDLTLGWRNSERLALEAELEWITNRDGIGFGSWLFGVNGKFFFLEERVQPYMVLGAGAMWTKMPGALGFIDDWAFRNGLGVDYYLDEHWALTGETTFVWGVGDLWKNYFMTFSVGAQYRF